MPACGNDGMDAGLHWDDDDTGAGNHHLHAQRPRRDHKPLRRPAPHPSCGAAGTGRRCILAPWWLRASDDEQLADSPAELEVFKDEEDPVVSRMAEPGGAPLLAVAAPDDDDEDGQPRGSPKAMPRDGEDGDAAGRRRAPPSPPPPRPPRRRWRCACGRRSAAAAGERCRCPGRARRPPRRRPAARRAAPRPFRVPAAARRARSVFPVAAAPARARPKARRRPSSCRR